LITPISVGIDLDPYYSKERGNWLTGQRASETVTFCPSDDKEDKDEKSKEVMIYQDKHLVELWEN
jgi:hypothetical protein